MHVLKWPAESYDNTIIRTTKGLYWHHYDQALPTDVRVKPYYFNGLPSGLNEILTHSKHASIGCDLFRYLYVRAAEEPKVSFWIFEFYRSHVAGALTFPEDRADELAEDDDWG